MSEKIKQYPQLEGWFYRKVKTAFKLKTADGKTVKTFAKGETVRTSEGELEEETCLVMSSDEKGRLYMDRVKLDKFEDGDITGGVDGKGKLPPYIFTPFTKFRIVTVPNHVAHNTPYLFYLQYRNNESEPWSWVYDKGTSVQVGPGMQRMYVKKFFIGRQQAREWIMEQVMVEEKTLTIAEFKKHDGINISYYRDVEDGQQ